MSQRTSKSNGNGEVSKGKPFQPRVRNDVPRAFYELQDD